MNVYSAAISKGRLRRVRTPEGARYFRLPIGSLITPSAIHRAMERVGDTDKVLAALEREDLKNHGAEGMMDRSEAIRAMNRKIIREKLAARAKAAKSKEEVRAHSEYLLPFQRRRDEMMSRIAAERKSK